jgi:hypothetical protein
MVMFEILQKLIRRDCVNPFTQGVDAASACCSFFECPYKRSTHPYEFNQWFRGFNVVRRRQVDEALKASGRKTLREWAT